MTEEYIDKKINEIDTNLKQIELLEASIKSIIDEELNSEALFNIFKQKTEENIVESLKNKAIIQLNGGNMPKKKIAQQMMQTKEYEEILDTLKNKNLEILNNAKSFSDVNFISAKEKKDFILANIQNNDNKEKYDNIKQNINSLKQTNQKIISSLKSSITKEIQEFDFMAIVMNDYNDILKTAKEKLEDYFKTNTEICYYDRDYRSDVEIQAEKINDYFEYLFFMDNFSNLIGKLLLGFDDSLYLFTFYYIADRLPNPIKQYMEYDDFSDEICEKISEDSFDSTFIENLLDDLSSIFTEEYIMKLLRKNKRYKQTFDYMDYLKYEIPNIIVDKIPDKYINLYPLARKYKRHFVLHIGPTNSGKTWSALQKLKESNHGVYLAPLRLLAFEKYQELNEEGFSCSLKTGEEQILKDDSKFISSTIEMVDLTKTYDCAVVDECQMINDDSRGGAWTNVILGLISPEIHLCLSPNAKDILIKLIEECDDTYEIIEYTRKNELVCEEQKFVFPNDVQKGDALIVFSKKNVYAVAAELQESDFKCSLIYGALPYDVKQSEAEKFNNGETDVIVSTDAIGMGLNLPIRRIIFLELEKFDGQNIRKLYSTESKQIAGRAGRYGKSEYGLYNIYGNNKDKRKLKNDIEKTDFQINNAVISFPEYLINIEGKISDILKGWNNIETNKYYKKQNVDVQIELAKEIEHFSKNKALIFTFINFGFDTKNENLKDLWSQIFYSERDNKKYNIPKWILSEKDNISQWNLEELEEKFKECDLLYQYYDKFNYKDDIAYIMNKKQKISKQMIKLLKSQKISHKKCSRCGAKLPWFYKYNTCEECHQQRYWYNYRYNENDWDDYF